MFAMFYSARPRSNHGVGPPHTELVFRSPPVGLCAVPVGLGQSPIPQGLVKTNENALLLVTHLCQKTPRKCLKACEDLWQRCLDAEKLHKNLQGRAFGSAEDEDSVVVHSARCLLLRS